MFKIVKFAILCLAVCISAAGIEASKVLYLFKVQPANTEQIRMLQDPAVLTIWANDIQLLHPLLVGKSVTLLVEESNVKAFEAFLQTSDIKHRNKGATFVINRIEAKQYLTSTDNSRFDEDAETIQIPVGYFNTSYIEKGTEQSRKEGWDFAKVAKFVTSQVYEASTPAPPIGVKYIIHGFRESSSEPWIASLTREYRNRGYKVVLLDWQYYSQPFFGPLAYFETPAPYTYPVGQVLADMLVKQSEMWRIEPKHIHLIGFSLGSQISAVAARGFFIRKKELIGRITGLDPAGPYFSNDLKDMDLKLDKSDATCVDVIHTDL